MELDWKKLLKIAYEKALKSNDPSTQNGAILINDRGEILAVAINCFPAGVVESAERWERPLKYKVIEHAERNVCYCAAKNGVKTEGLIMVCPWAPCADCARAIIQSGVKKLVTHKQAYELSPERWKKDIDFALEMLHEAGVEVLMYDGKIGAKELLHSGKLWSP